jgi:hypothetical protein
MLTDVTVIPHSIYAGTRSRSLQGIVKLRSLLVGTGKRKTPTEATSDNRTGILMTHWQGKGKREQHRKKQRDLPGVRLS